jgi:glycosyltransferase involved in cell wall biosynthesis
VTLLDLVPFLALAFAALPCLLCIRNLKLFRPPVPQSGYHPAISVLIPARNEAAGIRECLAHICRSEGVVLEVIVLDDHSTDGTDRVVQDFANDFDGRVRLERAPTLPAGWSGKQHACFVLSGHAKHDIITFLDADVRIEPAALLQMASFMQSSQASLVSGFPRQETGTILEKLLIPLINWLLVCYLPMDRMRKDKQPGLGAGCGQWFMTTRSAYTTVGGHEAVKDSFHDGVKLPRAYRRQGYMTDVCDATSAATCRMYRSASQVWNGLAKNAREGLGSPGIIVIWTVLLGAGHLLPFVALLLVPWLSIYGVTATLIAIMLSYVPRILSAARFQQSWLSVALHPVGVALLLAIQWYATLRHWIGRPVGWKGRPLPTSGG